MIAYLLCGGCGLQQSLLFPQTACDDASDLHGLLQVLALQVLFDAPQVVLVKDVVLLQETAVLLVDLSQQVMEHQRGVRLLIGCIRPAEETGVIGKKTFICVLSIRLVISFNTL